MLPRISDVDDFKPFDLPFCFVRSHFSLVLLIGCVLVAGSGCSQEKLKEMANSVNETVREQADNLNKVAVDAEIIPVSGRAEIMLTPPVEMKAAYARLYVTGDGRPGVLQFTSYDPDKGPNTFPALLIRANTTATSIAGLGGQSLNAQVFFQTQSGGAILSTGETGLVPVTIAPADPSKKTLDATIAAGSLIDSAGKPTAIGGITIEGVTP